MMRPPVVLSIAGFDGSGGAGIQADLKTFSALGCYGMTVLTALPVQNTCGVKSFYELPVACIQDQLEAIFDDIRPDSIKIGLLYSACIVDCVANFLQKYGSEIPITLDPVMIAKSGAPLLRSDAVDGLKNQLIPMCTILTPNLPEARALGADLASCEEEMAGSSSQLLKLGSKSVLLKGGHLQGDKARDLYIDSELTYWINGKKIATKNTHGTGCTLSAAIACGLALGLSSRKACSMAKRYVLGALEGSQHWEMGQGHGPLNHGWELPAFETVRRRNAGDKKQTGQKKLIKFPLANFL